MAHKLSDYTGSIVLSDGLTQRGDYPLMEAHDIQVDVNDLRLDTKLEAQDSKLADLETNKTSVNTRLDTLETNKTSVNTRLNTLETNETSILSKITALETADVGINAEIEALKAKNSLIEQRLDAFEAGGAAGVSLQSLGLSEDTTADLINTALYGYNVEDDSIDSRLDEIEDALSTNGVYTLKGRLENIETKLPKALSVGKMELDTVAAYTATNLDKTGASLINRTFDICTRHFGVKRVHVTQYDIETDFFCAVVPTTSITGDFTGLSVLSMRVWVKAKYPDTMFFKCVKLGDEDMLPDIVIDKIYETTA